MENKKNLVGIIIALVAVVVLAAVGYNVLKGGQTAATPDLGSPAASSQGAANRSGTDNATNVESTTATSTSAAEGTGENASSEAGSGASTATMKLDDFSVKTLDGGEAKLSSVYGKPALVGFWATWCPPCNAEAPELQKLYETYGDRVNFMMIDAASDGRDNAETVKTWLEEGGYNYPVYIDETGEAAMAAQIYYLPTMFVLDKEGNVLTSFSGALDEASGTQLIEQLLAL